MEKAAPSQVCRKVEGGEAEHGKSARQPRRPSPTQRERAKPPPPPIAAPAAARPRRSQGGRAQATRTAGRRNRRGCRWRFARPRSHSSRRPLWAALQARPVCCWCAYRCPQRAAACRVLKRRRGQMHYLHYGAAQTRNAFCITYTKPMSSGTCYAPRAALTLDLLPFRPPRTPPLPPRPSPNPLQCKCAAAAAARPCWLPSPRCWRAQRMKRRERAASEGHCRHALLAPALCALPSRVSAEARAP